MPPAIADRAVELARRATQLASAVPAHTAGDLAGLVRIMNCYYSNLIEGHNTRPRDIERALGEQIDDDRRDLQLEARAHVRVQEAVDEKAATGTMPDPTSADFLRWVHAQFYRDAPEPLLRVEHPKGAFRMVPGEFRSGPGQDVIVGRHRPPSSHRVAEVMEYFQEKCSLEGKGAADALIAIAIAHHRFNYIHPFPDGNGRVSRLMSHAMMLQAGFGAHGLWSISRGLARGLTGPGEYKDMMDLADTPRQGDTDGRGNLSLRALHRFIEWFLDVASDQVEFMSSLFDLEGLRGRLQNHVLQNLGLRRECAVLADALYLRGELSRGDAALAMGLKPRTASSAIRQLVDTGLVVSASEKGRLRLRYGTDSSDALFPRLFLAQ